MSSDTLANLIANNPSLSACVENSKKRKETEKTFVSPESKSGKMSEPSENSLPSRSDPEMFEKALSQFLPSIQKIIDLAVKDLKTEMEKDRDCVRDIAISVKELQISQVSLSERVSSIENTLESGPTVNIEAVRDAILPDLSKSISQSVHVQWTECLKQEIAMVESSLIIHGLQSQISCKKDALSFFEEKLKISTDDIQKLNIMSVQSLGNPKNSGNESSVKTSCIVKLGSYTERNICLKNAYNLPKAMSIDRIVPKRYLPKFKQLKATAWQLRMAQNLMTRIEFHGHSLCLKIKRKDDGELKYSWIIHEEYSPKLDSIKPTPPGKALSSAEGTIPTPPVSKDILSETVIFSNAQSDLPSESLLEEFKKIFSAKQNETINSVKMSNLNTFVVVCSNKDSARKLAIDFKAYKYNNSTLKSSSF